VERTTDYSSFSHSGVRRSLSLILDEIDRDSRAFDWLSIAWATLEHSTSFAASKRCHGEENQP
jgi:hypothetical protein